MDINTLRALSTVLVALAFIGICWWAFSPRRKQKFNEAAQLPFADEEHEVHQKGSLKDQLLALLGRGKK